MVALDWVDFKNVTSGIFISSVKLCHKILHWKKLDVNVYHLPLLPQCRVIAFVNSKFQYGMKIYKSS